MPKKPRDVQKESIRAAASNARSQQGKRKRAASSRPKKRAAPKVGATTLQTSGKKPTVKSRVNGGQVLPSEDQIRLRAYFIAEKRAQLSLPGDNDSDWLEAKRQLFNEAGIPLN